MSKTVYIFGTIVLLVTIIYLAKELYLYYFNFKEGVGMLGMAQQKQGIDTATPLQPELNRGTNVRNEPTSTPSNNSASTTNTSNEPDENEYQVSKNTYKYDGFKKGYSDISNNVNVQFHDDYSGEKDKYGNPSGTSYLRGKDGSTKAMLPTGLGVTATYYKPQDYIYGSLTYVPNYEDSVYLSRTANMFIGKPMVETSSIQGGVCNYYKQNPDQLEQACQHMDPNVCASTSCCVLLGGAKCVSGSENGPYMKSHYSNTLIPNRDFYYYQSKCYGNCPRQ
jgi:hypothetical protein